MALKEIDLGNVRGPVGPTGAKGVSMRLKGTWSSSTAYVNDGSYIDLVTSGGNTYACKKSNTNQAVSNSTYWELMAQKGATGPQGQPGLTDEERKLIQAWEKFKASGGEIGGRVSSEVFLTLLSNSQQYGMYNRGGHLAFPRYNSNGDFVDIPFEIQPNGDFYCNGYSKNTNGYNKLPNGMIEQWGVVNITGQAANAWCTGWSIQYPKLFPNAIVSLDIQILADGNSHDADLRVMPYLTENTNTFQYHCKVGANGTLKFKWRAIGY